MPKPNPNEGRVCNHWECESLDGWWCLRELFGYDELEDNEEDPEIDAGD